MNSNELSLSKKLYALFFIITVAMFLSLMIGGLHIKEMKQNIDRLYFGSFTPTLQLNSIVHDYNSGVLKSLQKLRLGEISTDMMLASSLQALERIEHNWQLYVSHYKKPSELDFSSYASSEILRLNSAIEELCQSLEDGGVLSVDTAFLEGRIEAVVSIVESLVRYEGDVAKFERSEFLKNYDEIVYKIGSIAFATLLFVLLIAYYIFKSIQKDQSTLLKMTNSLKAANKRLESASYVDSLTSLYNRRYFNIVYERELSRARRAGDFVTFMMIDIDYFKQYNDTYGHLQGDEALRQVSIALHESLQRAGDFLFRLGGEEFGVLLIGLNESQSEAVAQKLLNAIRSKKLKHKSSEVGEFLSISIGVANTKASDTIDNEELMRRADSMLYEAKSSGRDRFELTTKVVGASSARIA
ncbi:MAG: GGDEF domain-containing protein [Sulfuricurvum sp.]